MLTAILFALNQVAIFLSSVLALVISVLRSASESVQAVSSANIVVKREVQRCKSLI
jgi:hypothetical protein